MKIDVSVQPVIFIKDWHLHSWYSVTRFENVSKTPSPHWCCLGIFHTDSSCPHTFSPALCTANLPNALLGWYPLSLTLMLFPLPSHLHTTLHPRQAALGAPFLPTDSWEMSLLVLSITREQFPWGRDNYWSLVNKGSHSWTSVMHPGSAYAFITLEELMQYTKWVLGGLEDLFSANSRLRTNRRIANLGGALQSSDSQPQC